MQFAVGSCVRVCVGGASRFLVWSCRDGFMSVHEPIHDIKAPSISRVIWTQTKGIHQIFLEWDKRYLLDPLKITSDDHIQIIMQRDHNIKGKCSANTTTMTDISIELITTLIHHHHQHFIQFSPCYALELS